MENMHMDIHSAVEYQQRTVLPDPGSRTQRRYPYPLEPRTFPGKPISLPEADSELLNRIIPARSYLADLREFSSWLFAAAGRISVDVKRTTVNGEEQKYTKEHYSYPSAGGLNPVQIWLSVRGDFGLEGLYGYMPHTHQLARICEIPLNSAWRTGGDQSGDPPQILMFLTVIIPRSALKYGARAWRYLGLDTGHVLGAVEAASHHFGLPTATLLQGPFAETESRLGIDPVQEELFAVAAVGELPSSDDAEHDADPPFPFMTLHSFNNAHSMLHHHFPDFPYPEIERIRLLCREFKLESDAADQDATDANLSDPSPGNPESFALLPLNREIPGPRLLDILGERQSSADFVVGDGITWQQLSNTLHILSHNSDLHPYFQYLNFHLLIHQVSDIDPGLYGWTPEHSRLTLRRSGLFRETGFHLSLDQGLGGSGAGLLFVTIPLHTLEQKLGPDVLRLAYMEAGRAGQQLYLSAATQEFGVSGIGAYLDLEVLDFLQLSWDEHAVLYLMGFGQGASDSYRHLGQIIYKNGDTRSIESIRQFGYGDL